MSEEEHGKESFFEGFANLLITFAAGGICALIAISIPAESVETFLSISLLISFIALFVTLYVMQKR